MRSSMVRVRTTTRRLSVWSPQLRAGVGGMELDLGRARVVELDFDTREYMVPHCRDVSSTQRAKRLVEFNA
jgi:hypothetical protein